MILTDEELNAAILDSGWTTRGPEAVKEFHALARSIERKIESKQLAAKSYTTGGCPDCGAHGVHYCVGRPVCPQGEGEIYVSKYPNHGS